MKSLQDMYAPNNKCFGCGPKNLHGLQIKSWVKDGLVVAEFIPQPHHQAFDNVLNGGICGTLLDCHSNWCAAYFIMKERNDKSPPCTVTARFAVELLKPTPMNKTIKIVAAPTAISENKAEIKAQLIVDEICTARCEGLFVAVSPGHPAYHRW
jgi:hypothetical protein